MAKGMKKVAKEMNADQEKEKAIVAEVNAVLQKHGYAIQTFLAFKEEGVFPGVKIVKLPAKEEAAK